MEEFSLCEFALQLSNNKVVSFESEEPYDETLRNVNALIRLSDNEAKQLLEFLQANLTTTSNEDTIASKIAKDSANEFVLAYKQEGDNNWNIS